MWFVSLEDNITRLNSHTHDGVNSSKITSSSVNSVKQTVLAGAFSLVGTQYRATVTMPGTLDFDNYVIVIKDPTTKDQVYLSVEKVTSTSFYIYTNTQQDYEVYLVS